MTEYWLISAPGDKTCQQTWETLNNVTSKHIDLCSNFRFHIPDLKVGTLDQLVGLSDDLTKLDTYVEVICHKLATNLQDILENKHNSVNEYLKINDNELSLYLTKFSWDMAKYPTKQSLKTLHDIINKKVSEIDNDLKNRLSVYNSLKGNLQTLERKQTGSLLLRNLGDLVKEENFILNSEYLQTLLVVVPKSLYKEWNSKYENLTLMVVPRSSRLLFEDNEHGLFNVTLFQNVVEEFKVKARENKFVVRDFQYNKEDIAKGKSELAKLEHDKKRQHTFLFRWLQVNFSEAFIAWIHVKALRLFVESVLRYGLPVNFLSVLILPNKKQTRKLREILNQLYSNLDTSIGQGPVDEIPGFSIGTQEYYPYVYFKINIDMFS